MAQSILRKPIPRSGKLLPVVGLGTWQTFDVGTASTERASLKEVLREFVQRGGSVIDSSPMYGRSETVGGDLAAELGIHKQLFVATKVWTSGREAGIRQMEESFRRLRVQKLDLMQVHNLLDYRTHLDDPAAFATTAAKSSSPRQNAHRHARAHAQLAGVGQREKLDFVDGRTTRWRNAMPRSEPLPLARIKSRYRAPVTQNSPKGAVVLAARAGKLRRPGLKRIGCASWAQFF